MKPDEQAPRSPLPGLLGSEGGSARTDSGGCYICQPDNPNAAEEGCSACEREFFHSGVVMVLDMDEVSG